MSETNNTKIMEAKEKAKELVKKFTEFHYVGYSDEITPDIDTAKKHAITTIDECLNALRMIDDSCFEFQAYNFYENVKKEIEQL